MTGAPLISCQECDLVQREAVLPRGGLARCARCGATLYRNHPESLERTLAFTTGAIVLFVLANAFPIIGLEVQGQLIQTTLYHAVRTLWDEDMKSVASLVFVTTIAAPALQLGALIYLLVPLRRGRLLPHYSLVYRALHAARPWGMLEVFMLGVLVSLVKLAHLASIVPGIALWAFAALVMLMAAIAATFDPRAFWIQVEGIA